MLFNSTDYLAFLAIFVAAYFVLRRWLAARNLLILVASYIFYGWADYRLIPLLLAVSVIGFIAGLAIDGASRPAWRRGWLIFAVTSMLSTLGLFKYLDFFGQTLAGAVHHFAGIDTHWRPIQLALPIGISFFTFQAISYVVDVFRRELPASRNPIDFLGYVAFFPQLVAGPIERGARLLPQIQSARVVTAADLHAAAWLVTWGFFKKVALADNLAPMVSLVFDAAPPPGPLVFLGTIAFGLQIYCDFSGYTDIARGTARLLGFHLMLNFHLPYFATDLRDFWRRWHISLSTWLRDYLYIPLGGNRLGPTRTTINLLLTMSLGGLWHGAAATFVLWGVWHGLGLALHRWWVGRAPRAWRLPSPAAWAVTSLFVFYGWLMFRARSGEHIADLTIALTDLSLPAWWTYYARNLAVLALPLLAVQVWQHRRGDTEAPLAAPLWLRAILQGAMIYLIAAFWRDEPPPFIYFQF